MAVLVVADDLQRYPTGLAGTRETIPHSPMIPDTHVPSDGETWKRTSMEWLRRGDFITLLMRYWDREDKPVEWTGTAVSTDSHGLWS